jgi:hypothetical protein
MEMIKMVTTAEHQYAGRRLYAGDEFDCEEQHIELMAKMGWAKPVKRGQIYGTRALTASKRSVLRRRK